MEQQASFLLIALTPWFGSDGHPSSGTWKSASGIERKPSLWCVGLPAQTRHHADLPNRTCEHVREEHFSGSRAHVAALAAPRPTDALTGYVRSELTGVG